MARLTKEQIMVGTEMVQLAVDSSGPAVVGRDRTGADIPAAAAGRRSGAGWPDG